MHALTIDMVRCCQDVLTEWYKDETLKAFLVRSTEAKMPAFCAGGDVKQVYLAGCQAPANESRPHGQGIAGVATADFFRDEYIMNYLLATSPIPQISIWDGVVMGKVSFCRARMHLYRSLLALALTVVATRGRSRSLHLRKVPRRDRAHGVCHARDRDRYVIVLIDHRTLRLLNTRPC
jgi:hypothetical protein